MKCAKCGNEVGRAQVICDDCGVLLTEESSRIESRPVSQEAKEVSSESVSKNQPAPAQTFEPGDELTPEQIVAALGEEEPRSSLEPEKTAEAKPAKIELELDNKQIENALKQAPTQTSPSSDTLEATSSNESPEPMEHTAEGGESLTETEAVEATLPKTAEKSNKKLDIAIWGIVIFLPFLAFISWYLCWKSNWQKKNKLIFIGVSAFYVLLSLGLSLIPLFLLPLLGM